MNSSSVGPIQEKLESMAGEVTTVMDQQLQVELEPLLKGWSSVVRSINKTRKLTSDMNIYKKLRIGNVKFEIACKVIHLSSVLLPVSVGVYGGYSRVSVSPCDEEESSPG